jgi:predicted amidophosphoribosyltransferase
VCDQACTPPGCTNYWCGREDRGFDLIWAIGPHSGPLRRVIAAYKYGGQRWWAVVLGRLVAGYLVEHSPWFEEVEVIMACPGRGTVRRPWDHMAAVLDTAQREAGELWPFEPGCVVKTADTRPLAAVGPPSSRRLWAASELRPALAVPDPDRVAGRRVLVVDDVFTDGSTLREVALVLRAAGASAVSGLVLARQPWSR